MRPAHHFQDPGKTYALLLKTQLGRQSIAP